MSLTISFQEKVGKLLRTNKFAILLEIAVVFVPFISLVMVGYRLGGNSVSLGGDYVLLGPPLTYLGLIFSLSAVWVTSRMRGVGWSEFGLARPKSWVRTILMGVGVAVALIVAIQIVKPLLLLAFPSSGTPDVSHFDPLHGNLPNLIINVVAVWITAGFVEEFLWRGYALSRLVDLQGKKTKLAWVIALVCCAGLFALHNSSQIAGGMILVFAVGLLFGAAYLAVRRNLWILIIAHALMDTLGFVLFYFGVV
ncbi:MAG: hypothetical protein C5S45_03610 [Candidatus Methanocomedens sp.]|nr:MAG: hypothetical protein C5S45_03610 [ANME-2 cluster archaeon]